MAALLSSLGQCRRLQGNLIRDLLSQTTLYRLRDKLLQLWDRNAPVNITQPQQGRACLPGLLAAWANAALLPNTVSCAAHRTLPCRSTPRQSCKWQDRCSLSQAGRSSHPTAYWTALHSTAWIAAHHRSHSEILAGNKQASCWQLARHAVSGAMPWQSAAHPWMQRPSPQAIA